MRESLTHGALLPFAGRLAARQVNPSSQTFWAPPLMVMPLTKETEETALANAVAGPIAAIANDATQGSSLGLIMF